jgi:RNA polymerase sigma-70 factor (ECF subfamily)
MNKHRVDLVWPDLRKKLISFIHARIRDKASAEDIAHEVYLRAHDKRSQLRDYNLPEPWIFGIARNAVMDYFRRRKAQPLENIVEVEEDTGLPNADFNRCVESCLQDEMKNLPDQYQQALMLAEMQGLPQVELADKLNLSYSGAKSRVQRARAMLKENMDRKYLIEADRYGNVITCENRPGSYCK